MRRVLSSAFGHPGILTSNRDILEASARSRERVAAATGRRLVAPWTGIVHKKSPSLADDGEEPCADAGVEHDEVWA